MSAMNGICRSCANACTAFDSGAQSSGLVRRIGTGPSAAVHVAAEIQVVLELAVIRQHVVPAPAGRSVRLPFGVVVGRAAIRHHAHHRGAAAHDAALGETDQRRIVLAAANAPSGRARNRRRCNRTWRRYRARRRARYPAACRARPRAAARAWLDRADSRLASTHPAAPPPMMMVSKLSVMYRPRPFDVPVSCAAD